MKGQTVISPVSPSRLISLTAETGDHAPISGWWRPDEDPQPFRYLQQGEIMPTLGGSRTLWTLAHELPPSQRVIYGAQPTA